MVSQLMRFGGGRVVAATVCHCVANIAAVFFVFIASVDLIGATSRGKFSQFICFFPPTILLTVFTTVTVRRFTIGGTG